MTDPTGTYGFAYDNMGRLIGTSTQYTFLSGHNMARLIADAVDQSGNTVVNAVGPETFAFEELVRLIAGRVRRSVLLVHLPMPVSYVSTFVTGLFVGDVVLTWEEYKGLMGNLLAPEGPSAGQTRLSEWLAENRERVGRQYASEVARHYGRSSANPYLGDSPAFLDNVLLSADGTTLFVGDAYFPPPSVIALEAGPRGGLKYGSTAALHGGAQAVGMATTQSGDLLFVGEAGNSAIAVLQVDGTRLTEIPGSPFPTTSSGYDSLTVSLVAVPGRSCQ